jgi:quinol monooxygenase YgiN
MKVFAEKRKELSQTIVSLIDSLRKEEGCRRCDFFRSMEDENKLCILEEWNTRENLNSHLKSERFRVLRGAMNLLREPCEMMVYTVQAGIRKQKCGASYQFDEEQYHSDLKGAKHVVDHRCHSTGFVGAGIVQRLHNGRSPSHPSGHRPHRGGGPGHSGPEAGVGIRTLNQGDAV